MENFKVLLFGNAQAIKSPRAVQLQNAFAKAGVGGSIALTPTDIAKYSSLPIAILVLGDGPPPILQSWISAFASWPKRPVFALLSEKPINAKLLAEFRPMKVVGPDEPVSVLCEFAVQQMKGNSRAIPNKKGPMVKPVLPKANSLPTRSQTRVGEDALDAIIALDEISLSPLARPMTPQELKFDQPSIADSGIVLPKAASEESSHSNADLGLDFSSESEPAIKLDAPVDLDGATRVGSGVENLDYFDDGENDDGEKTGMASAEDLKPFGEGPDDMGEESMATVFGALEDAGELPQPGASSSESADEPSAEDLDPILRELASAGEAAASEPLDVSSQVSLSPSRTQMDPGSADAGVIQRNAALKEREARENDATAGALQKELALVRERLRKSEEERRRLAVTLDEVTLEKRSLDDLRDQLQHQLQTVERNHYESVKGVQLRLDNASFSSSKAERKLTDFKERVQRDILKIRMRERELANKLELQKRDTEALLVAKDERLLSQKREIDRLEFEIQVLKERMVDDTERAEERASKLMRAVQSLKMAQGMLSGIEEEVIPSAVNPKGGMGEGDAA